MTMERYLTLQGAGTELAAILHPAAGEAAGDTAVIVLVGGPQYRVGSHRMFVQIARAFAEAGLTTLRFDFQGMGDSDGEFPGFERLCDDVRAGCDALVEAAPATRRIVLVGLCDGASAAAIYAGSDPRIAQLVLLNPWVHTEAGEARAFVWHYYPRRLLQADFWRGLVSGRVAVGKALRGLWTKLVASRAGGGDAVPGDFISRMRHGLERFDGRVDILLSDTDLTAAEFRDLIRSDAAWRSVADRARVEDMSRADHTFSTSAALGVMLERCVGAVRGAAQGGAG